jgi:hypothetical protein
MQGDAEGSMHRVIQKVPYKGSFRRIHIVLLRRIHIQDDE